MPDGTAPSRADVVHALGQLLADLAADLAQRSRRPVPRLSDSALPDQILVLAHDLLDASSGRAHAGPALVRAGDAVAAVHRTL